MDVVSQIITEYLKSNKRLVVPGLGAFLRKDDDGRVVFVEFLQKDDNVLTGLLSRAYSLSQQEAIQAAGRFRDDVLRQANSRGGYVIAGLGTMRMDANGVCDLDYDPQVKPSAASAPQPIQEPKPIPAQASVAQPIQPTPQPAPTPTAPTTSRPEPVRTSEPTPDPRPARPAIRPDEADEAYDMRGMRYQKPVKPAPDQRKRKADKFMLIAIVAAAIAILAMVYGVLAEKESDMPLSLPDQTQTEQAAPGN